MYNICQKVLVQCENARNSLYHALFAGICASPLPLSMLRVALVCLTEFRTVDALQHCKGGSGGIYKRKMLFAH